MTRVGIVGFGHVGQAMRRLFPAALVYDKHLPPFARGREALNATQVCFVCVPTPPGAGGSADLSAIYEVMGWLDAEVIVIKSTIPPGTTDRLRSRYGKRIVCSPEYFGESPYRNVWSTDPAAWPFVVVGGPAQDTRRVVDLFASALGPDVSYRQCDSAVAELAKYMENCWLASQVVFAWQFEALAQATGADYWEVREIWSLDPRVSRWHTAIFPDDPGFAGKCLPKDVAAIAALGDELGCDVGYLKAIQSFNDGLRERRFQEGTRETTILTAT